MIKLFFAVMVLSITCAAGTITLTRENTLNIRGPVTEDSVAGWSEELVRLHLARKGSKAVIYLVLDTPGGEIDAGLSFINLARTIPHVETITIFAASMGSGIVEGLPGIRHITPDGMLMFHRATVGLQGQINSGEFESRLAMVKKTVAVLEDTNAKRMKMARPTYQSAVKDELWILGTEAVYAKAADDVVTIKCEDRMLASTQLSTASFFGFSIKVEYSSCPLLRNGKVAKQDEQHYQSYLKYYEPK